MSGLVTVVKNFFSLSIGELLSRIAGIVLFVLLARYLGPEKYGTYSIAISFVTIFMLISNFGLDAIIMKDVSREHDLYNSYFSSAIYVKSIVSVLCIFIIMLILYFSKYDSLTNKAIIVYSFVIIFSANMNTSISIFNAFERMNYSAILNIIRSFGSFLIIGVLILFQSSLLSIIGSQPLVYLLTFLLSIYFLKSKIKRIEFKFDKNRIIYFLTVSWPFFLTGIIHIINFKVDIIMLSNFTDKKTVGFYSAANDLVVTLLVVPNLFATAFFPSMSKKFGEGTIERLKTESEFSLRFLSAIGVLLGLVFFTFSNFIINTVYGSEYIASAYLLSILSFIVIFTFAKVILNWLLTAIENIKLSMTEYLICLITNIVLNAILIPKYGAAGSAIATLTSYIIGFIFLFIILKIKIKGKIFYINYIKVMAILPIIFLNIYYSIIDNYILLFGTNVVIIIGYLILFRVFKWYEIVKLIKLK